MVRSVDFGTIWAVVQHAGRRWFAPLKGRKQDHVRLPAAVAAAADDAPDHTAAFHVGQHPTHRPLAQRGLIGEVSVTRFRTTKADYACFFGSRETLTICKPDLVLSREERDRFEAKSGFRGAAGVKQAKAFHASADYHHVRCNGHEFQLGPIQAQVVRILHAAARRGEPWQSGKAVLGEAGSRSLKMSDIFKSKKDWPLLIESNGRGAYRLAGL